MKKFYITCSGKWIQIAKLRLVSTKGVARSQIKQFKHEDYVRMYNGVAFINVVNSRIGSKLHQVRLIILI